MVVVWEAVGESEGTADARFSSKVADGQADNRRMQKAKAERLTVNIAHQLRSFGFH